MKSQLPFTIAVVDDNALMREAMHFRLTQLGYQVVLQAEHGKAFINQLEYTPSPDLVVLDINMPVMDGFETAMHLRRHFPEIKILFFSMETGRACFQKINEIGADGFLAKDAPSSELPKILSQIMQQKHKQVA
jgi:Response regulator containing a CheY-like receiver domain and an HTH DNA-binding domain